MKLNKITKAIASVGLSVANLVTINAWAAQQTVNFSAGSGSGFQSLKDGENSVNDVTGFSLIFDAGTAPDYISINDWQYFTGTAAYSTSLTSVNGGGTSVGMMLYEENGDAFSLESFTFLRQTSTDDGNYSITLKGYLDGDLKITRNVVIPNASSNTSFTMTRASDFNDDLFKNIDKVTLDFPVINSGSDYDPRHAIINIVIDNAVATDSTAPILSQVTPVTTPTNDNTPNYTFSTDEAGTLSMGGNCGTSTSTTISGTGNQTIILTQTDNSSALADGTYSNCTVTVTDAAGNSSDALAITSFTVDTTAPAVAEVTAVTTPTNDTTPSYTFSTTETGAFTVGGSCGTSTSTTISSTGNQPITLTDTDNSSVLAAGTYSNCTITVTDDAGNSNTPLTITSFIIDTTNPTFDGASSTPNDNATDVSVSNNIVIDFSENIALGSNVITIRDVTGSSNFAVFNVATDSDGATTTPNAGRIGIVNDKIYLNPTSDLTGNRNYAIRIHEDAVNDNAGNSFTEIGDDTTFNFTTANTTPDVDLNSGTGGNDNSVSFSEGSGALNIAPSATVTEADGDTITTITVSLTNDQDGNVEGLNVTAAAQNALSGISGASDITLQDTITVTGATASAAEVQTFLQNISYNNTSSSPNETARTVTVVINDGTANSTSRTATVSVSNVTSANSTAAGFNTTNGTNLSPAITFTDDNETLVITNANHATGSTADGGNGTDTLFAVDSVDLTGLTSLTNFETLTPDNDGALTLSESQHESFSTINGTGDNQFTIASANGDQSLTGDADIETYVLGTAMSFTLASGSQNVTGSTGNDTVNVAALTATGTLNGGTGTNTLQASSGANISGATLSAFSSLTLASGASVTMTEAQHDIFSTITAPGTETITISSSTDGLTGGSAVESYILSSANTFTLGAAGQNLTGSTGNDTVNVGALAATGTLAGGNGTDTLSVGNTGSIAGATLSGFENLSVASGGTASVAASQLSSFSGTISGSGTETLTISGDGNFSTVSAIENYTLSDDSTNARTVTISAAGHSVTGSVSSDAVTFDIGTLTYTGTITGENTVADTLSMGNGANITGATVSNVTNLTLASGATVNMTASQHGDFTGTITAPGSESINITGDGNITTLTGIESYNIGDDSTNTRTINISSSTTSVSATSGSDAITFSVGSNTYTGSLSGEPSVADVVSASDGADVTGGGFFNIGSLTLTSGATVAIDSVNVSNFSNAITGSGGTEVLKLMDGGTFNFANTTVSSVEGIALGTDSIFNITLTDNFNANGQSVSVTNTTGSAISTDQTINASAFASDVLVISATNFNGSDTFIGGSGADTIRPGGGTDSMTGNGGNDNFIGSTSDLSGDTIADLSIGDMITLTGVTGLSTNNVRFNGSSTLEVDTDATDFNISELTLSLTNAPGNDLAFTVADSGSDTVITFISANSAPVFSALNGGATFIENGTAVVLDSDVTIADTELDALNGSAGNYNNASLTINRSGGASSKDVFGNSGLLGVLTEGELFTYNGNSVGTVTTNSAGTLVLTFNSNASSAVVDAVLQTLTYANNSDDPSSSVSLNYTFSDGILNSTGTNQATVTITQLDDAPTDISLSATTINQSVTASGADVATISSTDLDDTSHTYTLVAPNTSTSGSCSSNTGNSSFQINGSILETQSAISSGTYIVCVQSDDSTSTFQESFSITVTDDVAPNAPTSLDLIASSDSGSLNTDNYTNDTTPTLSGLAEVGASITLLSDQTGNAVIGTGTATDGTWEITTSELTANVVHTITAKATDALSNVSVASTGIAITLDTVVPSTPSIPDLDTASDTGTSNTDNITTDTTPTLNGTATVGDVITLTSNVDGVLGTVTVPAGGIWSFTPSSAISAGSHTITAYASDLAGNNSTLSALLSITIDAGASTPTITTPIEGDGKVNASEDNDVVISGSGAEAGASVRVSVDGVIGTVTADGSGNWTLAGGNELDISSLNNGTLSINVTQTDTAGNTSSAATSSIILDNQIPSAVAITTPIEIDNKVNAAEDNDVLVQGSGAESSATVTVNIGGITKTATADASGNWSLAGNELDISSLNNGSLSVSATQSDSAGNTSTAATTSITLDNETPNTLTITTPISTDGKVSAAEDDALLITGAGAESGATVTVNVGGVSTTTTADSSGNWSLSGNELDISALNNGTLTVSATQADSAGNTSTAATTSITLDNQAPNALTITTPIEGDGKVNASEDNDVLVQGSGAESGATVTVNVGGVSTTTTADSSGNWSLSGNELDISALNNGTLTVSATQADSAGNTSTAATTSITLDNQAPNALTITTPIEGDGKVNASEDNDVLVQGGGAESGATVTVSIDGVTTTTTADSSGNWTLSGNELDLSALNNGTLTVSATQVDNAGNTSTAATTSITLDNQAPNALTITTPIEGDGKVNASEDNDVLVQGSGAESGATVTVNVGGVSTTTTADSSGNWSLSGNELDISALNNGTLTVSATQADSVGNTSTAATTSITLDNQAPNALTITTPIEGDGKVNAIEDNDVLVQGGGAESGATVTVSIDGVTTTTTADSSGNWTLSGNELDISALNNGTLTVSATQVDSAGNTSTAATTSITLDNQAPNALTITTPIEGDGKVNASEDNDVLVQGGGAESGATITVSIDGVTTTTTADSSGNWTLSGNELDISALNNGTLTVSATQVDSAGNTSTAATTSITLDNQAPNALTITTPIEGDGKVNASEDNDVLVQGGGAESGATVTVSIDGVTTTTTADTSGNWSLSGNELDISALNNGTLTVSATQVDSAGNTSTAATTSITLDNQAPNALTITTPIEGDGKVNANEDNDVLVQGGGAESGATITVSIDGVTKTTTADTSGNWSLSGNELDISALNNGTLTVSATQADSAGNTSTAATTSITLDNQAPNALTITTPIEGDGKVNASEDNDVLVQGGGAESGATVTVNIGGVTKTTTADTSGNWTLSGNELDISALNNGTLTVSATQADSAGNTSTAATTSITLDNQAPNALTITTPIEGDGKVNASEDNDVLVQGGGAESGATITVSIDGVTTTTTADSSGNWTLSGNELDISALNNGTLTVSATQVDSAGNTSTAATTTISLDNQAPNALTITTPIEGDGKVNASEDSDVLVQGGGAESGATVTVNIGGVIKTTTADTSGNWSLSGNELDISALNNGTLTVSATQADSAGNTSTAATTSITLDNQAPNALTITTPIEGDGKVNASEDNDVLVQGGGAESGATVTVNVGGVSTTTTADSSGNWSLSGNELDISALNNGTLTVSATQADTAGNTSTAATTSITLDNQAPNALTITTPIEGDGKVNASEDNDVLVQGGGAESGATVTVNVGGVSTTTTADSSGNWSLSGNELDISALNNGTLTVSAIQADSAGNTSTAATTSITLDNQAPNALTITMPIEGDGKVNASEDNDVLVQGGGAESGATVTVNIGGVTKTTTADTSGNWTLSGNELDISALNNGTLTVSATQADSAGNTSTAATTTIVLDNQTPSTLVINTPIEGDGIVNKDEDSDVEITGSGAESGATVSVDIAGVSQNVVANASGNWTLSGSELDISSLNNGTLTVSATQTDSAGNLSDLATKVITLDNVDPTGHSAAITQTEINRSNEAALSFTLSSLEGSGSFTYQITDGSNIVSSSAATTISAVTAEITDVDVTNLNEGTLTLSVAVSDSAGNEADDVTTSVIKRYNIKPVLSGSPITSIDEDAEYSFTPTLTDPDTADTQTFSITNKPNWATFDTATGLLSGTPTDQDVGTTTNVSIQVSDGTEDSDPLTFNIEVKNTNDAPIGEHFGFSLDEGALLTKVAADGVLSTATDDDTDSDDTLTAVKVTEPTSGTLTFNSDGSFSYQHDGSETTTDSFTYQVVDTAGEKSAIQTVSFTITSIEDAPVVVNDSATTDEDTPITFNVVANDSDAENNMVVSSAAVVDAATKGQVSIANGVVTYTPSSNVSGTDTFTYTVKDSTGLTSEKATVTVVITPVNDAPVASNFNEMVDEDTPTSALTVRSTATDVEDTVPTGDISLIAQPVKGSVSINQNDGTLIYTPAANENGQDTFTYTIADSDGLVSNTATVTVNIGAVNDRPVVANDAVTTDEDTVTSVAILANDSDVEDQGFNGANVLLEDKGDGVGEYSFASVSVNLDGSLAITPKADINGVHSFTYTVTDSEGLASQAATVTLTINAINDAPVALDNTAQLQEEGQFEVNVLGNDSDVDEGDSLDASSVTIVSDAANGQTQVTSAGAIIYTANANFFGDDSFTYTVKDSQGALSNVATVTMTVTSVNDKPVASAQAQTLDEDGSILLTLVATDVDQDTLSYRIVDEVTKGSLIQQSNDSWLYTPTANANGADSFTFVANDGEVDSDEVTVSLTITPINDKPTLAGQAVSTDEDTALTVTLSGEDIEGQSLSYTVVTDAVNGSVSLTGNSLVYTPNSDFNGSDSVSVVANDGELNSEVANIAITVTSVNDAPLISGTPATSVNEDSGYQFIPTASDTDNDTLTFSISNKPSWLSFNSATGELSGTPLNEQVGSYSNIIISVSDGTQTQSLAPFSITVINTNDAPSISGVPATQVNEDEAYSFTPSAQDMDGDTLSFSITNKPSWANFDAATGQLSGTPTNDDVGTQAGIVISVSDGSISTALPAFNLEVININDAPVLSGTPSTTVAEDSAYLFTPTISDVDNSVFVFSISNKPSWLNFDVNTGTLSGTPADEHVGIQQGIVISASDGTASVSLPAFAIEVTNTNDAPVGQNATFTLNEAQTLTVTSANGLLNNATDDDTDSGDSLSLVIVSEPQFGELSAQADGSFSYAHNGGEDVSDSFTYQIKDSSGELSPLYTATLTINAIADAPVAQDDTAQTNEDTGVTFSLTNNDTDAEGDMVVASAAVLVAPTKGNVTIANGVATYTPALNETGTDSFTYTVKDAAGNTSNTATVTIDITPVNDAPVAATIVISTQEDTASDATALKAQATDVEDTIPTGAITVVRSPSKGQVVIDETAGTFVYTPNSNEVGQDTFTYTIADSDGLVSNTATVTVNIGAVNDRPVVANDAVTTDEDTVTSVAILANDSDVEDQGFNGANVLLEDKGDGVGEYSFASVSVNLDGSLAITPKADINGVHSFTYTVTDSEGLASQAATVTLTINAINDAPVALDNTAQLQEEGQFEVNVLGNDSDVDEGDSLDASSVTIVSDAANGQTQVTSAGAIIYTANANFFGDDSFTYTVKDSQGALSNVATVTMTVTSVNDKPVASAQAQTLDEDGSILLTLVATDVDQDTLSYRIVDEVTKGSLIQQSNDSWLYTPTANANGADSFTFVANDGEVDSDEVTVSLTITPINDKPTLAGQAVSTDEDTALTVTLSGEDIEGQSLSYTVVTDAVSGSVSLTGNSLVYTPNSDFNGSDSVSVVANDGELNSEVANIAITVTSVNDAPLISGTPATSVNEDSGYQFIPTASDTDNDTLTFSISNKPSWLSFNSATGELSGTPLNEQVGSYSNIIISVSDGTQTQSLAPFSITVINTNDAPSISGIPATQVNEDEAYSFTPSAQDMDGDTLSFSITNKPSWANFDAATGQLSGTPTNDDVGTQAGIVISVSDAQLSASLVSFSITVNDTNEAPVAQSISLSLLEDNAISFSPTITDADGDVLTLVIMSQPQFGTLSQQGTSFTYTPNLNYFGADGFTYLASDGAEQSAVATASLNVTSVNDLPVANPDVFSFDENEQNIYTLDVLANDTDADEQQLNIIGVNASVGSVTIENGLVVYNAQASTQGTIQINYLIEDPDKARSKSTAKLTINQLDIGLPTIETPADVNVNAKGLFTKVNLGVPLASDSQGNRIGVSLVSPNILFAPGSHLVYWKAVDGNGLEAIATQNININPLISLSKDSQVAEDQTHMFSVFLNGESPVYPVTIPYTVLGTADSSDHNLTSGELIIESGVQGRVNFTVFADSELEGNETITISLADTLNLGARSTATITIVEDNVAPTITTSVHQGGQGRSLVTIGEELVTITGLVEDVNPNDNVSLSWLSIDNELINTSTNESEFTFSTQSLTAGVYKVSVTAEDDGEPRLSTTKEVYVEVIEALATLTEQDSDGDLIPDDQEGYSDSDNDGIPDYLDAISECNVMQEQAKDSDEFLVEGEPGVCIRKGITVSQNATGGVQLLDSELPADNDAVNIGGLFDFIASGLPNAGDTYSIVLPQRNPISQNSVYRKLKEGEWVDFVTTGENQILSAAGEPGYCPPPRSNEWTTGLIEGSWCVQLQIVDGGPNDDDGKANRSIVDPGGVAVVRSTNQLPQANPDEVTIGAGESITIDVLKNDTDLDGDSLSLTGVTVDFGEVSIVENQLLYTPPAAFVGVATIEYSISDGQGGTSNSTAKVNLVTNNAPTAVFDTASTNDQVSIEIDVLRNDTDIDGDELFIVNAKAMQGSTAINVNGTLQYTPKVGFEGVDTIDYTIKDSKGAKSAAQVEVTVKAVKSVAISNKSSGGSMGGLGLLLISVLVISRRKSLLPGFAIITTSCLLSTSAMADTWSIEGTLGQAKAKSALAKPDNDVNLISVDDTDTSWSLGVYYDLTKNWQVGLRYIDLGQGRVELTADTTNPDGVHIDYSRYVPVLPKGIATEIGYRFEPVESLSATLFLGAYRHQYEIQSGITGGAMLEHKEHDTKPYAGAALGYSVYKNTELLLKYTYYKVTKNDVGELSAGVKVRF